MTKYRVIEETGDLTGTKRFYIEYLGTNFSGKEIWKTKYLYHPNARPKLLEFDTLEEAENWVKYKIETVNRKIHNTFTTK